MKAAEKPLNEKARLKALNKYKILDSLPEEEYDAIVKIASSICGTPISLVSLVDEDRQWFKSKQGIDDDETPREFSFCAHSILHPEEVFEIKDARKDERFFDNPYTVNAPNVVFYAGAPLNTSDGYSLGTLCVIDNKPKTLNDSQKESLKMLANQVVKLFEARRNNIQLKKVNKEISELNEVLNSFAYRLTHDLKSPLNNINFLVDVLESDTKDLLKDSNCNEYFSLISDRIDYMENLIAEMLQYSTSKNKSDIYSNFNVKELVESIVNNIDVENKVQLHVNSLDFEIYNSKIGFLQVFQNLISNSKKFSDEEKVIITIDCIETSKMYNFTYQDNGPGISQEYWNKVFDLFETMDAKNQGSGIGLATVKSIIEKLGGNIYLSKRTDGDKGVCFNFSIEKVAN